MWADYTDALEQYGREICLEWIARGYVDNMLDRFQHKPDAEMPPWLGDDRLHVSHQANLVRKLPEHYRQYFPDVDETMPYFWVSNEKEYNG